MRKLLTTSAPMALQASPCSLLNVVLTCWSILYHSFISAQAHAGWGQLAFVSMTACRKTAAYLQHICVL